MIDMIRNFLARLLVAYINSHVVEVNGEYYPIDFGY